MATTQATPHVLRSRLIAVAVLGALVAGSMAVPPARGAVEHAEPRIGDGARSAPASRRGEPLGPPVHRLLDLSRLVETGLVAVQGVPSGDADEASPARRASLDRERKEHQDRPFSMNLFSKGDFVNQKTTYWCIPASTQTMMNMMDDGRPNRSRKLQARLYRVGDRLEEDGTFSDEREPDQWRGMGISEWVGLLNRFDYGPYELAGSGKRYKALRKAARMMRKTGKPVGLVVWRGAHAWVMSGFTATADPAVSKDFRVTSVWVQDPWYPRVSSIWGPSRPPNRRVSPRVLAQDFKPYGRPGRPNPERDGRYMLVLPRPAARSQAG